MAARRRTPRRRIGAFFDMDKTLIAENSGALFMRYRYEQGQLWALFVAPESQRLGLGSLLVEHVETHARKHGARQLGLSASLTGVEFYERLGYRRLAHRMHPSGATYDMVKGLP